MKKITIVSLIGLIFSIVILQYACKKAKTVSEPEKTLGINVSKVTNPDILAKLNIVKAQLNERQKKVATVKVYTPQFDWSNMEAAELGGYVSYVVPQSNYTSGDPSKYAIGVYLDSVDVNNTSTCIVRIDSISPAVRNINYLTMENETLLTMQADFLNENFNIIYQNTSYSTIALKGNAIKDLNHLVSDCGADAWACTMNAYSQYRGAVSWWLYVQTVFIPETGIAIAAGCMYKCVKQRSLNHN